jgi:hypothetical protein
MSDYDTTAGDRPPKKKRSWIAIAVGVVILLAFVAIGIIGVSVNYLRQNVVVVDTTGVDANRQFQDIYTRFPNQQPLLKIVDGKPQYVAERASHTMSEARLNTMHILAYDDQKGQAATVTLPFWIVRMKSGPFRISAYQRGWDDRGVSLRVDEIEKYGPGIVVDTSDQKHGRVLIWVD